MNWSRRHTLALGAALIVATNAVALLGVAYNRSGTPESELRLSQRELRPPYQWGLQRENSGLSLTLVWQAGEPYGSTAAWLDRAKLTELGFDVSRSAGRRHYEKVRDREVYLVLELAGSAYQAALDAARERAEKRKAEALAHPGDAKLKTQADFSQKQLFHEEHEASRLFVIDAGLDAGALRAKYADRSRYAIVRGRVRPTLQGDGDARRRLRLGSDQRQRQRAARHAQGLRRGPAPLVRIRAALHGPDDRGDGGVRQALRALARRRRAQALDDD